MATAREASSSEAGMVPGVIPTIVASYNIHSCVGPDGVMAPDRIADVIREMGPDLVALQEVEAQHRFGAFDQWLYLAQTLGYYCTPGISLRTQRRNYGNAVLTRHPPKAVRLHDLSIDGHEPRGAIDLDLDIPDGRPIRLIATHLGQRSLERRKQIEALLGILAAVRSETTLLLGDFREWRPGNRNLKTLRAPFRPSPAPPSFPARRPILALDRILVAGPCTLVDVRAHGSALARAASDHLPVRAKLHWEVP